ncbi:MAG: hypothetical protein KKF46_01605 [Nanoarchaeota archaeon]|nr:hypothetical protein [Nanoarchaeota archaeon]MBU1321027.1 hypothetical protein [Nanoarchaeota archaeon]MBU1598441.1 hypothetical protein [Nanoarchaeota archaeon]MBU2441367.1 hypothetical protein [Nanoarchaeota archaeon]
MRINKILSLKEYCNPCKAKCCKVSDKIGFSIISEEEKQEITEYYTKKYYKNPACFEKKNFGNEHYYVIKYTEKRLCYFLDDKNKCMIQKVKPLDCAIYPIKAVYGKKDIKLVIDPCCPASKELSQEFIEKAIEQSIASIKRFKPEVYNNWLEKHIGWVKKSKRLKK